MTAAPLFEPPIAVAPPHAGRAESRPRRAAVRSVAALVSVSLLSSCSNSSGPELVDQYALLKSAVEHGDPIDDDETSDFAARIDVTVTGRGVADYRVARGRYEPEMVVAVQIACVGEGRVHVRIAQTESSGFTRCDPVEPEKAAVIGIGWGRVALPTDAGFAITFRTDHDADFAARVVLAANPAK